MVGFYCGTPYHVMLAIHMSLHEFAGEDKCLVVLKNFSSTEKVHDVCIKEHLFKEVVIIDSHRFDRRREWTRRYRMFSFYPEFKALCKNYRFDRFIFFSADRMQDTFMIKLIMKKNPSCEFFIGEDGLGSYTKSDMYKPQGRENFWLDLLQRRKYLSCLKTSYFLNPELLTYVPDGKVLSIQKPNRDEQYFLSILNEIWNSKPIMDYGGILYLTQPFLENKQPILAEEQSYFIGYLQEKLGNRKLGVKLHPTSRNIGIPSGCNVIGSDVLFEAMVGNVRSKIFIGIYSGALFTPFLLWGDITPIILLCKLCSDQSRFGALETFLHRFSEKFEKQGGKIYIPKTINELGQVIDGSIKIGQ